jgi:hypothetical protein
MRTKLALGAFALLALTVGAHAGEPAEMDLALTSRGLYEFNFRCEFDHRGSGLGGADARAYAQVFAWLKRGGEWSKDLEVDNSDYNKLAVIFHHELKYANGAKLISRERHVEISAHGDPELDEVRSNTQAARTTSARFLSGQSRTCESELKSLEFVRRPAGMSSAGSPRGSK